jgi:DNA-binding NarL/FixJ family response regulator
LVAEGHSNKQIAKILTIAVRTVENHRAAILRKRDLTSSTALVRYAVRHKLIEP